MKPLSFVIFLVIFIVILNVNCDKESKYSERTNLTKVYKNLVHTLFLPDNINFTENENFKRIQIDINSVINSEDQGRICLENVTKCMEKDIEYKSTTDYLSQFMFSTIPPLDLTQVKGVSLPCQQQSRKYLNDLANFKLWALKMYDASAKIPSGILKGNVNQLGNFDLCLEANNQDIYGQYCLASMQIQVPSSPYLSGLHTLVHSFGHFKSDLDDPGHRVPRFSSINWALCIPSACTANDLELNVKAVVEQFTRNTELEINTKVDPIMCQSSEKKPVPFSTFLAVWIFGCIVLVTIISTIYDYNFVKNKNAWIMSFSLRKNLATILSIKRSSNDIEAIHGIRFLNAFLLLLAHKCMAVFFMPYVNRTSMIQYLSKPWTVLGRAASLYTDPFIMISGTLTAYSLLNRLAKRQKLNIFQEYASRILRIMPTFAALIAFCTLILPWLDSGPMWNLVVSQHSDKCKQYWWRNLLFIHNYFGFKDMCLTHTHHVGIDTQLFFISPFLVWILWKCHKRGVWILFGIAAISTMMRYYVTYTMKLSNYIHFGTSIKQLFNTADNMYILPVHRVTVYIIGIFLGYILHKFKNFTLSKAQLRIGNTTALICFFTSFFGPAFMGSINYKYNPTHAAWYAAFSPILWCLSFAWLIFTAHNGYRGFLERFFCWPGFTIWTKISYTVYLTQFPVYFYNVGTARTSEHYEFFSVMVNLKEYSWVVCLATMLTLFIEMPFQNIRNIIFSTSKDHCQEKFTEAKKIN